MMSAISAAASGAEVTLLERNEKLGKKIYITGKGRCNLTNDCDTADFFGNVFENPSFAYSSVYALDHDALKELLGKGGLVTKTERGERVFPVSDRASDVTKALSVLLERNGVKIHLHSMVSSVLAEDGHVTGVRLSDESVIPADSVILATGGRSYPSTGSDGSGYRMAEKLGHTVKETSPALTGFVTGEDWPGEISGLSLKNVNVTLYQKNKAVRSEFGEMLFTHKGVSGPVILTLSCLADLSKDPYISIDLKPALDEKKLDQRILRDFEEFHMKDFRNSLGKLFPASLASQIVMLSGIDPEKKVNQITAQERKSLVSLIKDLRLRITDLGTWNEAIITRGGVNVKEVNPSTLMSKKTEGLFFAGEILAMHGFTGGFNLQLAFSTGYLAGLSQAE